MTKIVARLAFLGAVAFATPGCDGFAQAVTSHTGVLARAGGHELSVDQAASLISPHERIPAQPQVAEIVANLWIDYMLLATAAAQDSTLSNVNVDLYLRPAMQQQLVWKLREQVIEVDTAVTDEDLRAEFEQDMPGLQVRARHILQRVPAEATAAQRDSVLTLTRQIRERALAGEDFAELAREFGQDGTAQQGGDLGFFPRGQMMGPFEEAAFALQPGQISDIVETPYGYHVIKVEERQTPDFEENKESFRATAVQRRTDKAEEDYLKSLTEPLGIEVQQGAVENAKEIANKPTMQLRGRAGSRALVRYQGGAYTAAEFLDIMRTWDQAQRGQMATAADDQIKQVLENLTRNEILIREAEKKGLQVTPVEEDSVRRQVQAQLAMAVRAAGLTAIQPQDGETMRQAVARKVNGFLDAIMRGEQNVIPLGPISFSLREQYGGEIYDRAIEEVVAKIEQMRPAQPAQPPQLPEPDTSGSR